jgi:hypothetical protein
MGREKSYLGRLPYCVTLHQMSLLFTTIRKKVWMPAYQYDSVHFLLIIRLISCPLDNVYILVVIVTVRTPNFKYEGFGFKAS